METLPHPLLLSPWLSPGLAAPSPSGPEREGGRKRRREGEGGGREDGEEGK